MEAGSRKQEAGSRKQGHIFSKMKCRLGNQLFMYAFVRALQVKFYPDYQIEANFYDFRNSTEQEKIYGNENQLKYFQIEDIIYSEDNPLKSATFMQAGLYFLRNRVLLKILPGNFLQRIDKKILQPLSNVLFGLYNPLTLSDYVKPRKSLSHKIFCSTNFENEQYFRDIRDILLKEFTPKYNILPHNIELVNDICNSESVCVHIRRGDFLSMEDFNVCNEDYFVIAMQEIRKEIPDCKFFVFSDDIELVKNTIHFPFDVTFESNINPAYESLRLMYSCKNFIISNSTMSWWAQYLSRNENKIVYAPTPWHWTGEKWEGLYLPYMRKIECHKN